MKLHSIPFPIILVALFLFVGYTANFHSAIPTEAQKKDVTLPYIEKSKQPDQSIEIKPVGKRYGQPVYQCFDEKKASLTDSELDDLAFGNCNEDDMAYYKNCQPLKYDRCLVINEIYDQTMAADWTSSEIFIAWDVAKCESKYDMNAKNKNSSASGVYQFTSGTWKNIKAPGSPFDYKENIRQFIK